MTRSDTDSWDLASSVGATATMVAAARAMASAEPDPLINDPYAADLVRAVGVEFFTKLVDGEVDLDGRAGRGRRADDRHHGGADAVLRRLLHRRAGDAGIRQAVILASVWTPAPTDCRGPTARVVYEIDQPAVIGVQDRPP